MRFVADQVAEHGLGDLSVLEVGSYDVNGTVRGLFAGPYIGVDMRDGPGVDHVTTADELPFGDAIFEVVVCTEMLEHDSRPWRSIDEMARVLRPGGRLLLTCRGYNEQGCFPVHDYPDDLWRFSARALVVLMTDAGFEQVDVVADPQAAGWFASAHKPQEA